jgi:dethiobiotin synthetase
MIEPQVENHLVVEGAGGVFVPLNEFRLCDRFDSADYKVVVSRHYLGIINHVINN